MKFYLGLFKQAAKARLHSTEFDAPSVNDILKPFRRHAAYSALQDLTKSDGMARGETGAIFGISIGVAKGGGETGAILGISIGVAADAGVGATVT